MDSSAIIVRRREAAAQSRREAVIDDRPWNFVLHDSGVRRLDLHLFEESPDGQVHYGGVGGERFPPEALAGAGVIGGRTVKCQSPDWSLRWHVGYTPRDEDRHDVELLCATFGFELPDEFATDSS